MILLYRTRSIGEDTINQLLFQLSLLIWHSHMSVAEVFLTDFLPCLLFFLHTHPAAWMVHTR